MVSNSDPKSSDNSASRWLYGLIAVIAGLLTILAAFAIALWQLKTPADVSVVLGIVVSPVSAIVGAYFGVQVGNAGKEAADENARRNIASGAVLGAANTPDQVQTAVRSLM
jgi:hypothetical protein